jgi:hypothetical protein
MNANTTFYLCPMCFEVSEVEREHHGHRMICCDAGQPGDERRKPVIDERGNVKSHAPRWFLEAIGSLRVRSLETKPLAHSSVNTEA